MENLTLVLDINVVLLALSVALAIYLLYENGWAARDANPEENTTAPPVTTATQTDFTAHELKSVGQTATTHDAEYMPSNDKSSDSGEMESGEDSNTLLPYCDCPCHNMYGTKNRINFQWVNFLCEKSNKPKTWMHPCNCSCPVITRVMTVTPLTTSDYEITEDEGQNQVCQENVRCNETKPRDDPKNTQPLLVTCSYYYTPRLQRPEIVFITDKSDEDDVCILKQADESITEDDASNVKKEDSKLCDEILRGCALLDKKRLETKEESRICKPEEELDSSIRRLSDEMQVLIADSDKSEEDEDDDLLGEPFQRYCDDIEFGITREQEQELFQHYPLRPFLRSRTLELMEPIEEEPGLEIEDF